MWYNDLVDPARSASLPTVGGCPPSHARPARSSSNAFSTFALASTPSDLSS